MLSAGNPGVTKPVLNGQKSIFRYALLSAPSVCFRPIADIRWVSHSWLMITEAEMMEPLLVADPTFRATWVALVAEYDDDPRPPIYIGLGEFAQHLIRRQEQGDTKGFDEVFAVVERWHVDGDHFVSEAATVGFLESLQNWLGGNDRGEAAHFEPYLGPVSRTWWEKLYSFWEGNDTALRSNS